MIACANRRPSAWINGVVVTGSRLLTSREEQDRERQVVGLIRLASQRRDDLTSLADLAGLAGDAVLQERQPGQCRHAQRMPVLGRLDPLAPIRLFALQELDAFRYRLARSPDRPSCCLGREPDRSGRRQLTH